MAKTKTAPAKKKKTVTKKAGPPAKAKKKAAAKPAAGRSDKALVRFDPLQRYLAEISNYRLLTRDEERELGIRVQEHSDPDAAYRLVVNGVGPAPATPPPRARARAAAGGRARPCALRSRATPCPGPSAGRSR